MTTFPQWHTKHKCIWDERTRVLNLYWTWKIAHHTHTLKGIQLVNTQLKLVWNYLKRWSDLSHDCRKEITEYHSCSHRWLELNHAVMLSNPSGVAVACVSPMEGTPMEKNPKEFTQKCGWSRSRWSVSHWWGEEFAWLGFFFSCSFLSHCFCRNTWRHFSAESLEETFHYLQNPAAPLQLISRFIKNGTDTGGNFLTGAALCDVSFDAEGNASGTVGYWASANQFLMQYHPHQKVLSSPTSTRELAERRSLPQYAANVGKAGGGKKKKTLKFIKTDHCYSFDSTAIQ